MTAAGYPGFVSVDGSELFVPVALLPSQFARTLPDTGERKLLLAVLADAFDDLRRPARRTTTFHWFKAPDSGPLSLQFICDALGFDLAGVQAAALRLYRQAHPRPS